ncbi:MFS transporter [Actinophytocola oryzae]|uniref:Transmembrane secretion effector n=1 Tax=Actinophytocola oryzae TaxID=502181 RepID=A0A4R7UX30_9PSEU|nr:MFS transporter [Actinophytocola oryzae]TDV40085.1 transmembrane secretion effector [Actinophytocola oryzae]
MDFRRLWLADAVNQLGTRMTFLAAPLVAVLYLDASTFEVALVRTCETLGWLVFGLLAGAWVDRVRCRPVLLSTDLGRAVLMLTVPAAALFGALTLWHLYLVMFLVGVQTVFFEVAHQTYLPRLLPPDELVPANAKLAGNASVAALAGASLGGFLVQLLTAPFVFAVDAVSFLWSALWVRAIRHREPPVTRAPDRHLGREIAEGVRYVWHSPLLRPIALSTATTVLGQGAGMAVSTVFLVRDIGLSAGVIGLLGTVGLLGALLSSGLARRLVTWIGRPRAMVYGTALMGLGFLAQAFTTPGWGLVWWVASGFVASFCIILTNVVSATIRQTVCPPQLLGRVSATMELTMWGVMPAAAVSGGLLGAVAGTRVALLAAGAVSCLAVTWLLASPLARQTETVGVTR